MTDTKLSKKVRTRGIYTLYIVALLDLLAVSLFLPLISREISHLGASPFMVGVVGSVYGGIQLFSSPILGRQSDKYGRRVVLIVALAASAFAYIIQGSATSLVVMLVARSLAGLFKHTQTIGKAILAELAPNEKAYVFGNINAMGSIGYIIGPALGGHIVEYENGFHTVCYLCAGLFVINMVLVSLMVPEPSTKHEKDSQKFKNNNKSDGTGNTCCDVDIGSMTRTAIFAVMMLRFLFSFATIAPRANLPIIFDSKFKASTVSQGYLNSLQALIGTLTGFMVGSISTIIYREDHRKMVLHGGIVHMISLLGLFFAPSFNLSGLSLMLMSAVNPFQRVGIVALSLHGTDDPGAILGLGQTATSLARMLGPATAGLAQTYMGDDGPALVGALSAVLGVFCTVFLIPRTPPNVYVKDKDT